MEVRIYSANDVVKAVMHNREQADFSDAKWFNHIEKLMQLTGKISGAHWFVVCDVCIKGSPLHTFCSLLLETYGQPTNELLLWIDLLDNLKYEYLATYSDIHAIKKAMKVEGN